MIASSLHGFISGFDPFVASVIIITASAIAILAIVWVFGKVSDSLGGYLRSHDLRRRVRVRVAGLDAEAGGIVRQANELSDGPISGRYASQAEECLSGIRSSAKTLEALSAQASDLLESDPDLAVRAADAYESHITRQWTRLIRLRRIYETASGESGAVVRQTDDPSIREEPPEPPSCCAGRCFGGMRGAAGG